METLTITKKERLMLANQQMAALMGIGAYASDAATHALESVDTLLSMSGFQVEGADLETHYMD